MTKFFFEKKIFFEIFKIGKILKIFKIFKNHGKQTKYQSDKQNAKTCRKFAKNLAY